MVSTEPGWLQYHPEVEGCSGHSRDRGRIESVHGDLHPGPAGPAHEKLRRIASFHSRIGMEFVLDVLFSVLCQQNCSRFE
ncbi:hypothetical protein [Faecalibaculum rodentium]|uniref:hypothetical protein n=1 Tax=Faecalibaculum rodentium TaxID=1702221 RepID=UPI0023EFE633|nr:hypothetical protein [Faecalibaculum rodentium]